MQHQAHSTIDLDELSFPELDDLRHRLRLTQKRVCEEASLDPATYHRWLKWAHGEDGGSRPQPRSLKALRDVLRSHVSAGAARSADVNATAA